MPLFSKSLSDPASPADGARLLIVRVPCGGAWDEHHPHLAPSRSLEQAWAVDAADPGGSQRDALEQRFHEEMQAPRAQEALWQLRGRLSAGETLTLLGTSRDERRCHRELVRDLLEELAALPGELTPLHGATTFLAREAAEGDRAALAALFSGRAWERRATARIARMLGLPRGAPDVQDALQESRTRIVLALRDGSRWDPTRSFTVWAVGLVRNVTRELRRQRLRLQLLGDESGELVGGLPAQEDALGGREALQLIGELLQSLPAETGRLWRLYRLEDLTLQQIATREGVSVATVHRRVHAADAALRAHLRHLLG